MKPRREFIKTASAAMLALGTAPATLAARPRRIVSGRKRIVPLAYLHYADFAELLGTTFNVTESSGAVLPMLLAEADDLSNRFGVKIFQCCFTAPRTSPSRRQPTSSSIGGWAPFRYSSCPCGVMDALRVTRPSSTGLPDLTSTGGRSPP
jgi:hypothetical protein